MTRFTLLLVVLAVAVLTAFVGSLLVGPAALAWQTSFGAMFGGSNEAARVVILEIRLPRAILAAAIGAILGLTGAALQGLLRNPLAEPGVLGIGASASLGAVLAIYAGVSSLSSFGVPIAAMAGAGIAVVLIRSLAGADAGTLSLILSGIAVSSFASALSALTLNLATNPFAALEIVFWMLGSLADRSMMHVWLAVPFILIGGALILATRRALDALTLGTDVAATLGIDPARTQALVVAGTAIGVGASTAVAGSIGFVGLVVPHVLRPLVGGQPSRLLPASALGGAALLLTADIAVRLIAPERDLKLGVLTAIIGAPFFLWLVLKTRREVL